VVFLYGLAVVLMDKDHWLSSSCKNDLSALNSNGTIGSNGTSDTVDDDKWKSLFNNEATPVFALIVCLWSSYFGEVWKRAQITKAVEWDVTQLEEEELPRPAFNGNQVRANLLTHEPEVYMSIVRGIYLKAASLTVSFTYVSLVFVAVLSIITLRFVMAASPASSLVPSVLNTVVIFIFSNIYQHVAYYLNDLENHRTETVYNDNLIYKLFLFDFVNTFTSLFYLAYVANSAFEARVFPRSESEAPSCNGDCMTDLSVQVVSYLLGTPLLKTFQQNLLPRLMAFFRKHKPSTWYEAEHASGEEPFGRDPTIPE
jgi:anoctamin-5